MPYPGGHSALASAASGTEDLGAFHACGRGRQTPVSNSSRTNGLMPEFSSPPGSGSCWAGLASMVHAPAAQREHTHRLGGKSVLDAYGDQLLDHISWKRRINVEAQRSGGF